jgi:hypothetical protein
MAITLGKDHSTPPFGAGIITASYTEEIETVDISNRENVGAGVGYRQNAAGFITKTWEIECHDAAGLVAALEANATSGFTVMNVSENISVDGAVTYTVTAKEA